MFEFFRRFQRSIFLAITCLLVVFFAFFGVSSVLAPSGQAAEDRVVARALDGSPLMLSEVRLLSRFIALDQKDFLAGTRGANLCNNGVLRFDFQESGLAALLVDSYAGRLPMKADGSDENFLSLVAQFILNTAKLARQKGFQVTVEEAKGDLLWNYQSAIEQLPKSSPSSCGGFSQHLRSLGFDEFHAAQTWQNVLLFRRYFQGVSESVFVDRLPYQEFASYACEAAKINLYQWPSALRLRSAEDWLELQMYLQAVAPYAEKDFSFPQEYYSVEEIAERYPELVEIEFRANISKISLPQAALRASMREIWNWECEADHWQQMQQAFSFLGSAQNEEERFERLNRLSDKQRLQVDGFVRRCLLEKHPEWIEQAWEDALTYEEVFRVSPAWSSLAGISKPEILLTLLSRAAEGEDESNRALHSYCEDGKQICRFTHIQSMHPERILTFAEAKERGILRAWADKKLRDQYIEIRAKFPKKFQSQDGKWKSYSAIKEDLIQLVYQEELKSRKIAEFPMVFLSRQALCQLQQDPLNPRWVGEKEGSLFANQFKLIMSEKRVLRAEEEHWAHPEAFTLEAGQWSSVHALNHGDVSFFCFLGKEEGLSSVVDRVALGKKELSSDAKRYLAQKILERIAQTQAITVPVEGGV